MGRNSPIGRRHQARPDLAVWLSEWLARRRQSPAASTYGNNEPPSAGPGGRGSLTGLPAKRVRLPREYQPGFGWQSLVLGVVLLAVAVAVLTPKDVLNRIINGPPPLSPTRPHVLVVSGRWSDHAAVMQTVRARGYTVRAAADVESGLLKAQGDPDRIGIVVIDMDLQSASRMISGAKKTCPEARLILLQGPRDAARISHLLLDAGMQ